MFSARRFTGRSEASNDRLSSSLSLRRSATAMSFIPSGSSSRIFRCRRSCFISLTKRCCCRASIDQGGGRAAEARPLCRSDSTHFQEKTVVVGIGAFITHVTTMSLAMFEWTLHVRCAPRRHRQWPRSAGSAVSKGLIEGIADAAHGADRVLLAASDQRLAQTPDLHVHRALVDFCRSLRV